jgi:hypothetical protein
VPPLGMGPTVGTTPVELERESDPAPHRSPGLDGVDPPRGRRTLINM